MISKLSVSQTREMLCATCDRVIKEKQRLTSLDGPIGDGDHGIGMSRGMTRAKEVLLNADADSVNELFCSMGRSLLSTMGGSSGVIFGTMFMGAVRGMDKRTEFNGKTFTDMMRNALAAVQEKGKAEPGEKTMVDALAPAVAALEGTGKEDLEDFEDLVNLIGSAAKAAEEGAEATKDMISRHGHSKTLGERALGHPDPGAVSVAVIFAAMKDYLLFCERSAMKGDRHMIILNVTYDCKPGMRQAFYEALRTKADYFRKEEGNIQYAYYNALEDDNKLLLVEKWESGEALKAHSSTEIFRSLAEIKDKYVIRTELDRFEV